MLQKRGIILLVTLFFIITITTLYLKNLDDSNKLIENSQNKYNLNYTIKLVDDLNIIISKLNTEYELNTDDSFDSFFEALPQSSIPIELNNVSVNINFDKLEFKCNINDIYDSNETKRVTCIDVFNNNNINIEDFTQYTQTFYKALDNNISNNKQKDYIIDMYLDNSLYSEENHLKENITYLKDTNSSKYLQCSYEIHINNKKINTIDTIYKLDQNGTKVENIEISYK